MALQIIIKDTSTNEVLKTVDAESALITRTHKEQVKTSLIVKEKDKQKDLPEIATHLLNFISQLCVEDNILADEIDKFFNDKLAFTEKEEEEEQEQPRSNIHILTDEV